MSWTEATSSCRKGVTSLSSSESLVSVDPESGIGLYSVELIDDDKGLLDTKDDDKEPVFATVADMLKAAGALSLDERIAEFRKTHGMPPLNSKKTNIGLGLWCEETSEEEVDPDE